MPMREHRLIVRRAVLFAACLILLAAGPLFSAVKQVRVTLERASIYIEPSRTSARIDIVGKGTILNLLQERKVKDVWYYVSFNSPRYGSRISGFIQDSAVELAVPSPPAPPKKEEKVPPKVEREQAKPPEAAPPPEAKVKKELPKEPPPAPRIVEALGLTKLPKGKVYSFPRRVLPLQEAAWRIIEIAPIIEKKRPIEVREIAVLTVPPKRRTFNFPKKEKPLDEPAWRIIQPVIAEMPKAKESAEPKPAPPEVKKKPAVVKPEPKPVEPQPITMPQVRPPRKGPGFLSLGLGYGSSFGGAGGCFQLNTGMGLSLHAGIGLYPTTLVYSETDWVKNEMLWSVGLKYYLPFGSPSLTPFVDLQYGGLRVEAAQVIIGIWDYQYVFSQEQKSLWGPSLIAGIELRTGRFAFIAGVGASYATTSWDYVENKVSFVFDSGLMIHF